MTPETPTSAYFSPLSFHFGLVFLCHKWYSLSALEFLTSCFKWVTATRVAWLSKLLGMRAACILAFSPSSAAAADRQPRVDLLVGPAAGAQVAGRSRRDVTQAPGGPTAHAHCSAGGAPPPAPPSRPRPAPCAPPAAGQGELAG